MNIVVVPVYRRPAMLAALLRSIEASPKACYQRYLFSIDREAYKANDEVLATFSCAGYSIARRRHQYPGYTFNVLEGLRAARVQLKPTDLVYVIAEDVLISTDFFDFHEAAHKLDPRAIFVSSVTGSRKFFAKEIDSLVYKAPLTSIRAISFQAYRLERVLDHAVKPYYRDMIGYCETNLRSSHPIADAEVDGLMRRVFERSTDNYGLHPVMPRACHVGYVGTNHGGRPAIEKLDPAAWREDAERIPSLTTDQLTELAPPGYRDVERCQLIRDSVPLKLV